MAVKAVIDTNIWVSAILNPFGYSSKLLRSFAKGLFQPAISEQMFLELAEVLNRPRIKDKFVTGSSRIIPPASTPKIGIRKVKEAIRATW